MSSSSQNTGGNGGEERKGEGSNSSPPQRGKYHNQLYGMDTPLSEEDFLQLFEEFRRSRNKASSATVAVPPSTTSQTTTATSSAGENRTLDETFISVVTDRRFIEKYGELSEERFNHYYQCVREKPEVQEKLRNRARQSAPADAAPLKGDTIPAVQEEEEARPPQPSAATAERFEQQRIENEQRRAAAFQRFLEAQQQQRVMQQQRRVIDEQRFAAGAAFLWEAAKIAMISALFSDGDRKKFAMFFCALLGMKLIGKATQFFSLAVVHRDTGGGGQGGGVQRPRQESKIGRVFAVIFLVISTYFVSLFPSWRLDKFEVELAHRYSAQAGAEPEGAPAEADEGIAGAAHED